MSASEKTQYKLTENTVIWAFSDIEGQKQILDNSLRSITNKQGQTLFVFENNLWQVQESVVKYMDWHVVICGDLVDNGDDDEYIIEQIKHLLNTYSYNFHVVLGNRDINKLRVYIERYLYETTLQQHINRLQLQKYGLVDTSSRDKLWDTSFGIREFNNKSKHDRLNKYGHIDRFGTNFITVLIRSVPALIIGRYLFVHGGPINNITTIKDIPEKSSLHHVNQEYLNVWQTTPLEEYIKDLNYMRAEAINATIREQYDNEYLMRFISLSAPNYTVNSIITGSMDLSKHTIDTTIYQWLRKGNIDTIVRGHQPIGQVAMVQQLSPNNQISEMVNEHITVVHLDTSYSNGSPSQTRTWCSIAQLHQNKIKLHAYVFDPNNYTSIKHYTWSSDKQQSMKFEKDDDGNQTYCMSYKCKNCNTVGDYSFCMYKPSKEKHYITQPLTNLDKPIKSTLPPTKLDKIIKSAHSMWKNNVRFNKTRIG